MRPILLSPLAADLGVRSVLVEALPGGRASAVSADARLIFRFSCLSREGKACENRRGIFVTSSESADGFL